MERPHQSHGAALAEEVLRRLKGVVAVRAAADAQGTLQTIHVLARPERSPKILANDIVAVLAAELGLLVDPRQIRIALLRPDDRAAPAAATRLKFTGLTVSTVEDTVEVKVRLDDAGLAYEGVASGPGLGHRRLDLIAQATIRAVETYLRTDGLFVVEGVAITTLGPRQVAVVAVALLAPTEELLAGSSLVRDDPREAVVRAVLDAINRPVSWLAGA